LVFHSLILTIMNERKTKRRRGGFQPPFCPNHDCQFHLPDPAWSFIRFGFYSPAYSHRSYQVFRCKHCGRRFTALTFSTSHWLHRKPLLRKIAALIAEGPGLRQIARFLGTTHSLVGRYVSRLGRHCLLYLRKKLKDHIIDEPIVFDGFESFEYSQYYPFHINIAVGADSWYIYNFTDSPLRRKGTMTATQKAKREELEETMGRPIPKAVENGIYGLLHPLVEHLPDGVLRLHCDDHKAYPRALRRLKRDVKSLNRIKLTVTSSKARRTSKNPLFPVNLTDLRLRHGSANHRRETIAFSKRRQCAMERMAILSVSHNFVQKRSQNGSDQSSARVRGIETKRLSWKEILKQRLFPERFVLPREWLDYYFRRTCTLMLAGKEIHHASRIAR
jgi:hypothetical protein